MIFLKHFDVANQSLVGAAKVYVNRASKVGELLGTIHQLMGWPTTTPLKLYEEIKPGMIEVMKLKATFAISEIQDGDVICFQVDYGPDKEWVSVARHLLHTGFMLTSPLPFAPSRLSDRTLPRASSSRTRLAFMTTSKTES